MGPAVFDKVYRILQMHRDNDSEPSVVADSLKAVTTNRQMKQLCFALEQIVWME